MDARYFISICLFCFLFPFKSTFCDESYETDRGYREPAVVGVAIPEEDMQILAEPPIDGVDDAQELSSANIPAP